MSLCDSLGNYICPPVDFVMTSFVDHFRTRKQWFSEPFYTRDKGYKMCLSVFANGIGQAEISHVSVFANLMRGEFDDMLAWPFRGFLKVEMHTNESVYEEAFRFRSRSPAKACGRVLIGDRNEFGQGCVKCIPHNKLVPFPSTLRLRVCSVTVRS